MTKMAGIEISEEITDDQLDAMSGGELLRQEVRQALRCLVILIKGDKSDIDTMCNRNQGLPETGDKTCIKVCCHTDKEE